jgi:hypothetical protein
MKMERKFNQLQILRRSSPEDLFLFVLRIINLYERRKIMFKFFKKSKTQETLDKIIDNLKIMKDCQKEFNSKLDQLILEVDEKMKK